jgi:hypothetical protein
MRRFLTVAMMALLFVGFAYAQKAKIGGGVILAAPAPEDSSDRIVYVQPIAGHNDTLYPVIRETLKLGKGDRTRLRYEIKRKDSASYADVFPRWDYKQTEKDSSKQLLKVDFINK